MQNIRLPGHLAPLDVDRQHSSWVAFVTVFEIIEDTLAFSQDSDRKIVRLAYGRHIHTDDVSQGRKVHVSS